MTKATGFVVVLTFAFAAAAALPGCQSARPSSAETGAAEAAPTGAPHVHTRVTYATPSPSPSPSPSPAPGSRTVTLVVHGMGCPLCANNVDKQLLKLPNVQRVNVDLGSGQVQVTMAPGSAPPPRPQLAKAVAHSGYTLVKVQTP